MAEDIHDTLLALNDRVKYWLERCTKLGYDIPKDSWGSFEHRLDQTGLFSTVPSVSNRLLEHDLDLDSHEVYKQAEKTLYDKIDAIRTNYSIILENLYFMTAKEGEKYLTEEIGYSKEQLDSFCGVPPTTAIVKPVDLSLILGVIK
jgi:hypothetical protein